jgi:hypothetical protein
MKVFDLIKDEFAEFKESSINLNMISYEDLEEDESPASISFESSICSDKIENLTISIIKDVEVYKNKEFYDYNKTIKSDAEFFQMMNIILSEHSIITAWLLHEFGHLYQIIRFIELSNINYYTNMRQINESLIATTFRFGDKIKDYFKMTDIFIEFSFNEIYAEMFKFKYFAKIWIKVKEILYPDNNKLKSDRDLPLVTQECDKDYLTVEDYTKWYSAYWIQKGGTIIHMGMNTDLLPDEVSKIYCSELWCDHCINPLVFDKMSKVFNVSYDEDTMNAILDRWLTDWLECDVCELIKYIPEGHKYRTRMEN